MKNKMNVIGMMSGTSADGLSLAYCFIDFSKRKIKVKAYKTYEYSKNLTNRIINARNLSLSEVVELHYELGRLWASMIENFIKKFKIKDIDLISSHGQTIYHSSKDKLTFQIGEVEFISRRFNIPVAYDFRVGDIVFGGEGAPLIPFMDWFLFGERKSVALLNIGGISNISVVGRKIKTYGFDIGPGNTLMDWAINIYSKGRKTYDKDGLLASKGRVDFKKIEKFLKNPFFYKKPPRSLDREEFGKEFVIKNFDFKKKKIEDILATLNYFTAVSIKIAIERFVKEELEELIISGGGVYNKKLIENIKNLLTKLKVKSISDYEIHPLAKEAVGFALLGAARILKIQSNFPEVTGSKKRVVLGKISNP